MTAENFEGETLFFIPNVGSLVQFVGTTRGMILGITGILALLILNYLLPSGKPEKESLKNPKKKREKKRSFFDLFFLCNHMFFPFLVRS